MTWGRIQALQTTILDNILGAKQNWPIKKFFIIYLLWNVRTDVAKKWRKKLNFRTFEGLFGHICILAGLNNVTWRLIKGIARRNIFFSTLFIIHWRITHKVNVPTLELNKTNISIFCDPGVSPNPLDSYPG